MRRPRLTTALRIARVTWVTVACSLVVLGAIWALGGSGRQGKHVNREIPAGYAADGTRMNDPWRRFIAPARVCPGSRDAGLPAPEQLAAELCLVNYARTKNGLRPLRESPTVSGWSALKAADITRCGSFSHEACGRPGDYWPRVAGFSGSFGENIYMGSTIFRTPLAAIDGWLNSPTHRAILFLGRWRRTGIARVETKSLAGQREVAVWVNEFTD